MNTKFTKGPWRAEQTIERDDVFLDICAEDSPVVSDVGVNGATEEQRRANAALIATATEMYAELKQAAECISDLSQGKGGWDYEGVIHGIEALLEKARGEA